MAEAAKEDQIDMSRLMAATDEAKINFQKPILIYLPCHNCAQKIEQVLNEIPKEFHPQIECLIVDNCSTDATSEIVLKVIRQKKFPFRIHLIRTKENLGYAGSQKLAFSLAIESAPVKHIIVLHGDGQYPPVHLKKFLPFIEKDYSLVNGFRDKTTYPKEEETPLMTYRIIKFLSAVESFFLGLKQKEWHSGFVMYRRDFIRRVPLQYLSPYMHIDGEFLMCAGVLNEKTAAVPIYKRYKGFVFFCGHARRKYIWHVFKLMLRYKSGYYHRFLKSSEKTKIIDEYDNLTPLAKT